jgi:hypothetical protein
MPPRPNVASLPLPFAVCSGVNFSGTYVVPYLLNACCNPGSSTVRSIGVDTVGMRPISLPCSVYERGRSCVHCSTVCNMKSPFFLECWVISSSQSAGGCVAQLKSPNLTVDRQTTWLNSAFGSPWNTPCILGLLLIGFLQKIMAWMLMRSCKIVDSVVRFGPV